MWGDRDAHYLKPAGRHTSPPNVITLDSETRTTGEGGTEYEVLRCWCAQLARRRDRRRAGEREWAEGETPQAAAAAVDAWATSAESCWLYAHNVGFDLITTGLAAELSDLGWELSPRFGITAGGAWLVLRKGRRVSRRAADSHGHKGGEERIRWAHTLTIADSASILPKKLADLAQWAGIEKPPLPAQEDSAALWRARCRADTDILMALLLQVMDWWDSERIGPWSVTGAGLGWQTYRASLGVKQVVIDHDPALLAFERSAVYGGRRDVFTTGVLPPGRYGEIDFTAAYPTIAATMPLPAKVACPVDDRHRRLALSGRVPGGMLAEVTIRTPVPRWPVRLPSGVFYPVGEFRTTLAAPDIKAAADCGALVAVHDGYLYVMSTHLSAWARKALAWADPANESVPGAVRVAAKLWSRAVIGKFAQRGWSTIPWVGPPETGWSVTDTIDLWTGRKGTITGLCGTYWLSWADARGEHERPAVLAFVESHVRQRLSGLIAGPYGPAVAQCDTDGLLVSLGHLGQLAAQHSRSWRRRSPRADLVGLALAEMNAASWPLEAREKGVFTQVRVIGPQHMILDGRARFSGVPPGAWRTGDDTWAARLWPGLGWQAANAPPGAFARPVQGYRVTGPYAQAWVLADGTTRAAELSLAQDGHNRVLSWPETSWARSGLELGPRQAAWVEVISGAVEAGACGAGKDHAGP